MQEGADPLRVKASSSTTRPWILLENLGQTLASSAIPSVSLTTDLYWDPALVSLNPADPEDGSDSIFHVDVLTSGSDYYRLTTKVEGWYTLEMVHLWNNITSLSTSPAYGAQFVQFNTSGIPFNVDPQPGAAVDWTNGEDELNGYQYMQTYRTIWLPGSKPWPMTVAQTTGDNRGVEGHLKVFYDGNLGGSSDNADWEFATV